MSVLKQILKEKGWDTDNLNRLKPSQETLNKIGVSTVNQWNKLLNGELEPTISQAKSISDWLNVPLERFINKSIANKS